MEDSTSSLSTTCQYILIDLNQCLNYNQSISFTGLSFKRFLRRTKEQVSNIQKKNNLKVNVTKIPLSVLQIPSFKNDSTVTTNQTETNRMACRCPKARDFNFRHQTGLNYSRGILIGKLSFSNPNTSNFNENINRQLIFYQPIKNNLASNTSSISSSENSVLIQLPVYFASRNHLNWSQDETIWICLTQWNLINDSEPYLEVQSGFCLQKEPDFNLALSFGKPVYMEDFLKNSPMKIPNNLLSMFTHSHSDAASIFSSDSLGQVLAKSSILIANKKALYLIWVQDILNPNATNSKVKNSSVQPIYICVLLSGPELINLYPSIDIGDWLLLQNLKFKNSRKSGPKISVKIKSIENVHLLETLLIQNMINLWGFDQSQCLQDSENSPTSGLFSLEVFILKVLEDQLYLLDNGRLLITLGSTVNKYQVGDNFRFRTGTSLKLNHFHKFPSVFLEPYLSLRKDILSPVNEILVPCCISSMELLKFSTSLSHSYNFLLLPRGFLKDASIKDILLFHQISYLIRQFTADFDETMISFLCKAILEHRPKDSEPSSQRIVNKFILHSMCCDLSLDYSSFWVPIFNLSQLLEYCSTPTPNFINIDKLETGPILIGRFKFKPKLCFTLFSPEKQTIPCLVHINGITPTNQVDSSISDSIWLIHNFEVIRGMTDIFLQFSLESNINLSHNEQNPRDYLTFTSTQHISVNQLLKSIPHPRSVILEDMGFVNDGFKIYGQISHCILLSNNGDMWYKSDTANLSKDFPIKPKLSFIVKDLETPDQIICYFDSKENEDYLLPGQFVMLSGNFFAPPSGQVYGRINQVLVGLSNGLVDFIPSCFTNRPCSAEKHYNVNKSILSDKNNIDRFVSTKWLASSCRQFMLSFHNLPLNTYPSRNVSCLEASIIEVSYLEIKLTNDNLDIYMVCSINDGTCRPTKAIINSLSVFTTIFRLPHKNLESLLSKTIDRYCQGKFQYSIYQKETMRHYKLSNIDSDEFSDFSDSSFEDENETSPKSRLLLSRLINIIKDTNSQISSDSCCSPWSLVVEPRYSLNKSLSKSNNGSIFSNFGVFRPPLPHEDEHCIDTIYYPPEFSPDGNFDSYKINDPAPKSLASYRKTIHLYFYIIGAYVTNQP